MTVAAATSLVAPVVIMQPQAAPPFSSIASASTWDWREHLAVPRTLPGQLQLLDPPGLWSASDPPTTPSTDSVRIDSVGEGLDSVGTATTT